MANGTAVRLLPEPALPSIKTVADGPEATPAKNAGVELAIGETIARAAILTCLALEKYRDGKSTLTTNREGAELIVKLYMLQQSAPDIDLPTIALREGKRALRAILAENVSAAEALCPPGDLDQVLDEILGWPLGCLEHVTEVERELAH